MIKITTNADDIIKKFEKTIKVLPNSNSEAVKQVTELGTNVAISLAPKKSGKLIAGIKRKPVITNGNNIIGSFKIPTICLLIFLVIGNKRVPFPPAQIIPRLFWSMFCVLRSLPFERVSKNGFLMILFSYAYSYMIIF